MKDERQGAELAFLVHDKGDDVAVAVRDVVPGQAHAVYLKSGESLTIEVLAEIPLGHKVAIRDLGDDEPVIEYKVMVARTRHAINAGDYVHTHNIRSARWQNSA